MNVSDKVKLAERRRQVAEWALKGWTQGAIASQLRISQATVARDLEAVRHEWRQSAIRDFEEARGQQLHKLALVESEAWAAWQRSQAPIQSGSISDGKNGQRRLTSLRHQYGDPRFLEQINRCITQRCLLLGLQPAAIPQENDPNAGTTLETRRERMLGIIADFSQRERDGAVGTRHDLIQPGGPGLDCQPGEVAPGTSSVVPGPDTAPGH